MTDRIRPFTLATILPSDSGKLTVFFAEEFPIAIRRPTGTPLTISKLRFARQLRETGAYWDALEGNELMQQLVRALMIPTVDWIILIGADKDGPDRVAIYWADHSITDQEMAIALKASLLEHEVADGVLTYDEIFSIPHLDVPDREDLEEYPFLRQRRPHIFPAPPMWTRAQMRMGPDQKLVFIDPWDIASRQRLAELAMFIDPGRLAIGQVSKGHSAWLASIRRQFRSLRFRIRTIGGRVELDALYPDEPDDGLPQVTVSSGTPISALLVKFASDPGLLAQVLELAGIDVKE